MKFLKQLLLSLVVANSVICAVPKINWREQDFISIMEIAGKSIESELICINANNNQNEEIDFSKVNQFLDEKLPIIVNKMLIASNDLKPRERFFAIDLLRNLKDLSSYTKDDLMKMAEACFLYARKSGHKFADSAQREAEREVLETYAPELAKKFYSSSSLTPREKILLMKELEKVDLHNELFNLKKKFMCQCMYVDDLLLITKIDLSNNKAALSLQKLCVMLANAIAIPFVVLHDFYFFEGYEEAFAKVADIFYVVNRISSALLEEIPMFS